ncbi:ABC heavy metal transporter [Karstenula rhodostoma CBS 690.94]|uniref:ABC heavy metal transporter n=1 Tax=Karstenula rhodostoma CBS 690.94 TaxID=1392251 RepID=A0A9P4UCF3_9PLEO|nr:ABC heavy metal transporter [Karstenula rhodostoma CBS 690.94]
MSAFLLCVYPIGLYAVCYIAVAFYFAAGLLPDPHGPFFPMQVHCNSWVYSLILEIMIILFPTQASERDIAHFVLGIVRAVLLICMFGIYVSANYSSLYGMIDEEEVESLISNVSSTAKSGWYNYVVGFRVLFPYLWPSDSRKQQLILMVSLFLMLAQRAVNILVPYQIEILIASLGIGNTSFKEIGLYILYRGLQGQQGIVGSLRAIIWIPVGQSLFRRLTCAAFDHVLGLSLDFHLSKRLGEVMSALGKGSALNTFLDSFAFQLFPMVFDLAVAALYFSMRFDAFYSLILIGIMWSYIYTTIYMAQWRAKARRGMAVKDREMDAQKVDTMMSYETVHHNSAAVVESARFGEHVQDYQKAEFSVLWSLNALNIVQNLILTLGLSLFILLAALEIEIGIHKIPMLVSVLAYFTQLQAPLQFFGSFYNQVQNNLVDSERMLDLFNLKPTIVDSPNAKSLTDCVGRISFRNVSFAFDHRQLAVSNLSFTVEPGTSTAIVGESGSGKSTCLKLLFRFYDVNQGSIQVDGRDIRDLQIRSYRKHLAVVPQETILFNASIMYNLQYARLDATREEIYQVCRAASIHDRIMSFPEEYETKVGERGMRLSGGEKQRIAIARAILKNPKIVLMDEATASLDSHTEKQIQESLEVVTKAKTTIVIAHRLSTVINCDQIIVLHEGRIVEQGTHEALLGNQGRYASMWEKQTETLAQNDSDL